MENIRQAEDHFSMLDTLALAIKISVHKKTNKNPKNAKKERILRGHPQITWTL